MVKIEISAKEFNKLKTEIEESLRESVQCLMMSPNVSITEACDDSKIDEEDYFPLETIEELKNFEKKLRDARFRRSLVSILMIRGKFLLERKPKHIFPRA